MSVLWNSAKYYGCMPTNDVRQGSTLSSAIFRGSKNVLLNATASLWTVEFAGILQLH